MASEYFQRAIAIQNFEAFNKHQLSFKKGDSIKILSFGSDIEEWWEVLLKDRNGIVPSNHFILIDFDENTKIMGNGVAKFSFFHPSKAYLTLHKGDEVKIILSYNDGWSEGAIGTQRGLYPTDYVKKKEPKNNKFLIEEFIEIEGDMKNPNNNILLSSLNQSQENLLQKDKFKSDEKIPKNDKKDDKISVNKPSKSLSDDKIPKKGKNEKEKRLEEVNKSLDKDSTDRDSLSEKDEVSEKKSVKQITFSPKRDPYQNFITTLFMNESLMIQVMGKVHSKYQEEISKVLLSIISINNWEFTCITWLIRDEVEATKMGGTLYRRNSLNSHTLTAFARHYGSNYLIDLFAPLIKKLSKTKLTTLEINPEKVQDVQNLNSNVQKLTIVCQEFFDAIVKSRDLIPIEIKRVCAILRREVEGSKKFTDSPKVLYTVVGGFLFLRFICPCIVSPFTHGILPQVPAQDLQNALVLISKVLQNIANEVTSCKEKFMEPMLAFNNKNLQEFEEFIDNIIEDMGHYEIDTNLDVENVIAPIDETSYLIKFGVEKLSEIKNIFQSVKPSDENDLLKDFCEITLSAEQHKPTVSKIHPQNASPQSHNKPEFIVLTKDELEQVTAYTKKKFTSPKYTGFNESEKDAFLKIELMRAVEKKKKNSFELLFKVYQKDKKYQVLYKEAKRIMKEVDESLYNLEKQETKLFLIIAKRLNKN